jgi:integrase
MRQVEVRKDEGNYIDPAAGRITFGEFFGHYLETATHLKPSSRSLYAKHAKRYVLPSLGGRSLASITPVDVKALVGDLSGRVGPATARSVYRLVRRVLNVAVEEGRIGRNPAARIQLPADNRRQPRFLTADQVAGLVEATPERYQTLVLTLAYAGLRVGEAAALRVGDLDTLRGRIHVRRNSVEVDGVLIEGTPKGGRERVVRIPPFLRDALTAHVETYSRPRNPEARVFPGEHGASLRQSFFRRRVFTPSARQAGLDPLPRVHDLRHTAVALAVAAGYHPRAIQELAGHASITTTLDQYGGLFDTLQDEGVGRLEEIHQQAQAPEPAEVVELERDLG